MSRKVLEMNNNKKAVFVHITVALLICVVWTISAFFEITKLTYVVWGITFLGYFVNVIIFTYKTSGTKTEAKPVLQAKPIYTVDQIISVHLERYMRDVRSSLEKGNIAVSEQVRLIQYCAILVSGHLIPIEVLRERMFNYFDANVDLSFSESDKEKTNGTIQIGKNDLVHTYIS